MVNQQWNCRKLMDLLDRHVEDGNVTVQHAALSALRNLAIPGRVNKNGSQLCEIKSIVLEEIFTFM